MMNGISVFLILTYCVVFTNAAGNSSNFHGSKRHSRKQHVDGNCKQCGKGFRRDLKVPIIVKGETMRSKRVPWMVFLKNPANDELLCGAAIISDRFILTAAHCLIRHGKIVQPKQVTIGFRKRPLKIGPKPSGKVAEIRLHPAYTKKMGEVHDIALIRLQVPLRCNEYMNPICLPPKHSQIPVNSTLLITGWGSSTGEEKSTTPDLRLAKMRVVNKERCRELGFDDNDMDAIVCLSGDGEQSPCFGDSGGSMFRKMKGKYYTFGVASAHYSAHCHTNKVFVFTSTLPHLGWIHNEMSRARPKGSTTRKSTKKSKGSKRKTKGSTTKAKGSNQKKIKGSHRSSSGRRPA